MRPRAPANQARPERSDTPARSMPAVAYNAPLAVRFSGSLDVAVLRRTLNEIVRRHEILRTTFAEIGGLPQQIIAPPAEVNVPLIDLCAFGVEEREAAVRRHIDFAVQERFDLAHGPLFKAEILKVAENLLSQQRYDQAGGS